MQTAIPYMQFRGGSSKGVYFLASDLPDDESLRDKVLLAIMGGSDIRQIDGLGGAHPLTSKIGIAGPSSRDDSDVDYLFVQAVVGEDRVDITPNCGNILAGIGPFAIEKGLVQAEEGETTVRVYMVNSGNRCEIKVRTSRGRVEYQGDASIDGVPGTAAPVLCNYMDLEGSACGALLPTGNVIDEVDGIEVTCVDNGMPVAVLRANDFGITGYETADELNADSKLKEKLESIRLKVGLLMNLGDVSDKVVPKMSLIASPKHGGHVCTRTFIPHVCHTAVGVLGAVSVATACIMPGSVTKNIALVPDGNPKNLSVEHPSGEFSVSLEIGGTVDAPKVIRAGLLRTARLLSKGETYIPSHIWKGK
ncbi:MAG: 4-oxalomesaconate tautomerase [Gammaproteobacteria bacterium]|jgi:4-oxalomesaconate tautomerase